MQKGEITLLQGILIEFSGTEREPKTSIVLHFANNLNLQETFSIVDHFCRQRVTSGTRKSLSVEMTF